MLSLNLSENEKRIIDLIREKKPHEKILIQKDQLGRPDQYLVNVSQKMVLKQSGDVEYLSPATYDTENLII